MVVRENVAADAAGLVLFRVGSHQCALRLEAAQEVVPMALLSRPPGLPPLMEGLLNLRGTLVPVVRSDRLFGLGEYAPCPASQ